MIDPSGVPYSSASSYFVLSRLKPRATNGRHSRGPGGHAFVDLEGGGHQDEAGLSSRMQPNTPNRSGEKKY